MSIFFLQTNGVFSKQMAAGFFERMVTFFRNGATFKDKGQLSFFEECYIFKGHNAYFDAVSVV